MAPHYSLLHSLSYEQIIQSHVCFMGLPLSGIAFMQLLPIQNLHSRGFNQQFLRQFFLSCENIFIHNQKVMGEQGTVNVTGETLVF